jgi:hypothetical protein
MLSERSSRHTLLPFSFILIAVGTKGAIVKIVFGEKYLPV